MKKFTWTDMESVFVYPTLNTSFPKIHTLGTPAVKDILTSSEPLEITEKVDGSQFGFGKQDGQFFMRSKRIDLTEIPNPSFAAIVEYITHHVQSKIMSLPFDVVFFGEYLPRLKTNTLVYERTPKNHLLLFGMLSLKDGVYQAHQHDELEQFAQEFHMECVPVLHRGTDVTPELILHLTKDRVPYLGGKYIEGVVIKRYVEWYWSAANMTFPLQAAKFVQEAFKEKHSLSAEYKKPKDTWKEFCDGFATEARWRKAVQRLKEEGIFAQSPKDIGTLIRYVQEDVKEEDRELIEQQMWRLFGVQVLKASYCGLPNWYKEELAKGTV